MGTATGCISAWPPPSVSGAASSRGCEHHSFSLGRSARNWRRVSRQLALEAPVMEGKRGAMVDQGDVWVKAFWAITLARVLPVPHLGQLNSSGGGHPRHDDGGRHGASHPRRDHRLPGTRWHVGRQRSGARYRDCCSCHPISPAGPSYLKRLRRITTRAPSEPIR